jgi:hypothetical protein
VQFVKIQQKGKPVTYIWLGTSGENFQLKEETYRIFNITYEFTGPNTLQYYGIAERKVDIFYELMRSNIGNAKLLQTLHQQLWDEAANYLTNGMDCLYTSTNPLPPYAILHGTSKFWDQKKIEYIMTDRGILDICLGSAIYHDDTTYKLFHHLTNGSPQNIKNISIKLKTITSLSWSWKTLNMTNFHVPR